MKTEISNFKTLVTLAAALMTTHAGSAFYDANLGRWINRDPIGEATGPNLYAFVHSDPINFFDPDGNAEGRPIEYNPNAPQVTQPPAFPSLTTASDPKGIGGVSGGNLPPAFVPPIGYPSCSDLGTIRNVVPSPSPGFCPCTATPKKCFDYEKCEAYTGGATTHGTVLGKGWIPHHGCLKCPEGDYQ